ncbi:MAG: type I DNA topoisomerase, partial [Rhodospirillaceae bacterium]|nr:type I DNA topoisomerase [Rhodospirillaceae bacterium]
MNVVVVESPAKAKTINKYLGSDYIVLASFGHVRDLPPKNGSVDPENDFAMTWEVSDKAKKHMTEIAKAMKGADHLYLATDPDREGEAISWHIVELLRETNKLKDIPVSRVVFHEITKGAILEAMANPRELNRELIDAYLARRALDYLVGFTLSPVLWRKLPGSRSAGRVQSVALRLICERESEIEIFKPQEFWSVEGRFTNEGGSPLTTRLTHLHGEKLDKFTLGDESAAQNAVTTTQNGTYKVTSIERKTVRRNPQPPFTTSTLQQEASRKLGFAAKRTMSTAQRLYEGIALNGETVGLISYMRTDSVTLSGEALAGSRRVIEKEYGGDYLPPSPRVFKSKAKNAQEAHEAIRPTDLSRLPANIGTYLDDDQRRLYELIWKRTLASQMQNATLEQVAVDLSTPDDAARFRANGSIIVFDGFLRLYQESKDDAKESDDKERILPPMSEGEKVNLVDVTPDQHFTQPPPRYTEASLVGTLEELGIGRPSTYASIIDVLQARNYVRLDKRRFEPEDRGRLVTAFLENFFNTYVQYNFTADLEDQLDGISDGRIDWKKVLGDFWSSFIGAVDETKDLTIRQVIDVLDAQ